MSLPENRSDLAKKTSMFSQLKSKFIELNK